MMKPPPDEALSFGTAHTHSDEISSCDRSLIHFPFPSLFICKVEALDTQVPMNVLVFYLISLLLLCGVEPGDSFFLQQAARFGPTVVSFSSSSVPPPPSSPCTYQINDRLNINSWKTARVTGSTTTSSSSSRLYGRNEEDEDRSIRKLVDDTDIENEGNLMFLLCFSLIS